MKKLWERTEFRLWLAIVGSATLLLGAAYSMVQQEARLSLNDRPVSVTDSAKRLLESGSEPSDVVARQKTNLSQDDWLFTIVTDSSRHVLASSAILNGKTPLPPKGVFDYTQKHGSDTITWQPAKNVRLATYASTYKTDTGSGFVISGQSLKQTEDRLNKITFIAFAAWVIIVAWVSAILLLPGALKKKIV
jgi:hypothetical protein